MSGISECRSAPAQSRSACDGLEFLHDAPALRADKPVDHACCAGSRKTSQVGIHPAPVADKTPRRPSSRGISLLLSPRCLPRSEEHTSELQSPYDLVCRLLLEKKNKIKTLKL